jgi:uncharacterized membrane protein
MEKIQKYIKPTIMALSVVGILVSMYLTYAKLTSSPLLCLDTGCDQVQNSKYSEILGIPVAVFGAFFYFCMFVLAYKDLWKYAKVWTLLGLLFSIYLTYLELFVIYAICTWCVISLVIVVALALLSFIYKNEQPAPNQT